MMMKAPKLIGQLMKESELLRQQSQAIQKRQDEIRNEIKKELKKLRTDVFYVDDGEDKVLMARLSERKSIKYIFRYLRKRLKKDVLKRIVEPVVNPDRVQEEFDRGNITLDQLKGAFEMKKWDQLTIQRVSKDNLDKSQDEREEIS